MLKLHHKTMISGNTMLRQIPPLAVLDTWPRVATLIRSALRHGDGSFLESDIAAYCIQGQWHLWVVEFEGEIIAIGITDIQKVTRRQKCFLRYLAGSLEALLPHLPELQVWARVQGCDLMEGWGRKGWGKVMTGWSEPYVVYQKEL